MKLVLLCVVLLVGAVEVRGAALTDDTYSDNINTPVVANVSDGSDAIARFLGFKCPKGHRCLPVLECLPCDYGTYKAEEGSDLCTPCPGGCTTLRKGAESKTECVPKCPPGYEESECGKTCTKCRAGFYKSSWKNKPCSACPKTSTWNPNLVGMTKRMQCFEDLEDPLTTPSTTTTTAPIPDDKCAQLYGTCTKDDYDNVRLRLLEGSGCKKFCHCAHASTAQDGSVTYYWENQTCAAGTLFDESLPTPVCNHVNLVTCTDVTTTSPPSGSDSTSITPGDACSRLYGTCTKDDYDNVRVRLLEGSGCKKFCHCAHASTAQDGSVTYYWEEQTCAAGTLFDESLPTPVCNHENLVTCTDVTTTSPPSGSTAPVPGDACSHLYGTCTKDDYDNVRLRLLEGSGCKKFCHCAHASTSQVGSVTYYWEEQTCAAGTLFDENLPTPVCNHENQVTCVDPTTVTPPGPVPTTSPHDTSLDECIPGDPCNAYEESISRTIPWPGTRCKGYCVCKGLVWTESWCNPSLLYDQTLFIPACNYENYVNCTDDVVPVIPQPTAPPVIEDISVPIYGSCTPGEYCTDYELSVTRIIPYYGTNCSRYCQCKKSFDADGDPVLTWEVKLCPGQTILDQNLPTPNCNWATQTKCSECPYATADIVFVLDSSGSIGSDNFQKILLFVNQIIQVFDVSSTTTRFAVVTYGDTVYEYFLFTTYQNKTSLQTAVKSISYPGGSTYTHSALSFVETTILGSSGNRPNATDIVIVITDGKSSYSYLTDYYASRLHNVADLVMAVGIGNADQDELETIASSDQYVYFIDNFDALNVLKNELRQETCGSSTGVGTTVPPTGPTPSGSPSRSTTASDITDPPVTPVNVTADGCPSTTCSGNRLHAMGATNCTKYCQCDTASSTWVFDLFCPSGLRFNNLHQVCDWPENVNPNTCWPSDPADPTDGPTTSPPVTTTAPSPQECSPGASCTAYEESISKTIPWRGTGCKGYCICEGQVWSERWCDPTLLYDQTLYIPACNYEDYVYCNDTTIISPPPTQAPATPDYSVPVWGSCTPGDTCTDYEYSVSRIIPFYGTNCTQYCQCEKAAGSGDLTWEVQRCPSKTILDQNLPTPNCNWGVHSTCVECPYATADIVFVLDSSGSVGSDNFEKMLLFVNQIIQVFDVSSTTTRFALVTYGDNVYEYFYFSSYQDKLKLQEAVRGISYPGGYTYTHTALQFVQTRILGASDNRPNATDIVIVITDGKSTYASSTIYYARQLQQVADMVMAVGIGNADQDELENIASSPKYVYFIDNFDALNVLKKELRQETCGSSSGFGSLTTTMYSTGPAGPTVTPSSGTTHTVPDPVTTPPVTSSGCPATNCSGIRLVAMSATNCTSYCQCDTAANSWVANRACAAGLRFNNLRQVCDWDYNVDPTTCFPSSQPGPVNPQTTQMADPTSAPTTPAMTTAQPDTSLDQCIPGVACTTYEESTFRTISWPGTGCRGYCSCQGGLWVGQWCDPDLAYDESLYIPACNWEDYVTCNEDPTIPTVAPPPTSAPVTPDLSVPEYGTCTPGDACTSYERTTNRVLTFYGTNCTKYCRCIETTLSGGVTALRWAIQSCPGQTLLDQTLPSPNCNWRLTATCVECPAAVADIVFVLDSSGSVGSTNFAKMQDFVNQIIQVFDVSPTTTQFAAVTYGDSVYEDFSLSRYTDKDDLQSAIKNLIYQQGYTYTHSALDFVENTILAASDNRPSAPDFVIVITDGLSSYSYYTRIAAASLRNKADMVFAVGIGNADQTELEYIASSSQNVFFIDNFNALNKLKNELRQETCGGSLNYTATTPLPASTQGSTPGPTTGLPPTTASVTADGCPTTSCSGSSHIALPATGCEKFCQCNTLSGAWIPMGSCPSGLLFNNRDQVCTWAYNVNTATCRPFAR